MTIENLVIFALANIVGAIIGGLLVSYLLNRHYGP